MRTKLEIEVQRRRDVTRAALRRLGFRSMQYDAVLLNYTHSLAFEIDRRSLGCSRE
jgi:hypothetical protein